MAATATSAPKRKALATVRRGVLETPIRVLIYGAEKVGKSTFAAGAPAPIFIGAESGTERLDVARLQPQTWSEAVDWVAELAVEKHEYKTLVIDPVNWLEPLCWQAVCATDGSGTIEEYGGGYGKGYQAALDFWRSLLFSVEKCWHGGMNVVFVAHSHVKTFQNPEGPAYDRYEVAMHPKAAGVLKQWVDAVLFARLETIAKVEKGTKKAKGFSTGMRMVYTSPSAAYDAGARWKLPEELPLGWDDFVGAVEGERARAGELLEQIEKLTRELGDSKVTAFSASFAEKNKGNADKLAELANRINIKLDEKRKEAAQ
jgi:AAA domain